VHNKALSEIWNTPGPVNWNNNSSIGRWRDTYFHWLALYILESNAQRWMAGDDALTNRCFIFRPSKGWERRGSRCQPGRNTFVYQEKDHTSRVQKPELTKDFNDKEITVWCPVVLSLTSDTNVSSAWLTSALASSIQHVSILNFRCLVTFRPIQIYHRLISSFLECHRPSICWRYDLISFNSSLMFVLLRMWPLSGWGKDNSC
jgi:hypothetical protein